MLNYQRVSPTKHSSAPFFSLFLRFLPRSSFSSAAVTAPCRPARGTRRFWRCWMRGWRWRRRRCAWRWPRPGDDGRMGWKVFVILKLYIYIYTWLNFIVYQNMCIIVYIYIHQNMDLLQFNGILFLNFVDVIQSGVWWIIHLGYPKLGWLGDCLSKCCWCIDIHQERSIRYQEHCVAGFVYIYIYVYTLWKLRKIESSDLGRATCGSFFMWFPNEFSKSS